jgi:hypothetical protein
VVFEQVRVRKAFHGPVFVFQPGGAGAWNETPHHVAAAAAVPPKEGKGIAVFRGGQFCDVLERRHFDWKAFRVLDLAGVVGRLADEKFLRTTC